MALEQEAAAALQAAIQKTPKNHFLVHQQRTNTSKRGTKDKRNMRKHEKRKKRRKDAGVNRHLGNFYIN
jgi:hypothetical protein